MPSTIFYHNIVSFTSSFRNSYLEECPTDLFVFFTSAPDHSWISCISTNLFQDTFVMNPTTVMNGLTHNIRTNLYVRSQQLLLPQSPGFLMFFFRVSHSPHLWWRWWHGWDCLAHSYSVAMASMTVQGSWSCLHLYWPSAPHAQVWRARSPDEELIHWG